MKERPILFSGPMVRAIREGRKTQTRRLVTPAVDLDVVHWEYAPEIERWMGDTAPDLDSGDVSSVVRRCPYGGPGDRLWVRETFYVDDYRYPKERERIADFRDALHYRADHDCRDWEAGCPCWPEDSYGKRSEWRSSTTMPRWASRLTLAIEAVRVERLQEISEADARAEGVRTGRIPADEDAPERIGYVLGDDDGKCILYPTARRAFEIGWDGINGKSAPWASNPWVWVINFRVLS